MLPTCFYSVFVLLVLFGLIALFLLAQFPIDGFKFFSIKCDYSEMTPLIDLERKTCLLSFHCYYSLFMTHNLRDTIYHEPNESLYKHFKDTNCTVVDSFIHGESDCIVTSLAHRGCMRNILRYLYRINQTVWFIVYILQTTSLKVKLWQMYGKYFKVI